MSAVNCPDCHGKRLKPEALSVTVDGINIMDFCALSVDKALERIENMKLTSYQQRVGERILKEIKERLGFLKSVGLSYLTLSRSAGSLSGGESQRIRLATQIGSS